VNFSEVSDPRLNQINYEKLKTDCITRFINCYGKQGFVLAIKYFKLFGYYENFKRLQ